uniref:Acyltransferase 3 domain-containing protein n=1 Tax=Eutreptiella gymnastica TaxID=73025 RepID=A0A7S4FQZ6_9EUGL
MPMLFASGKDVPYDAGKYDLCIQIPTAQYFLVTLELSNPKITFPGLGMRNSIPMELGLCLPDVCTTQDISLLIREIYMDDPPFKLPWKLQRIKDFGHVDVKNVTSPQVNIEHPDWSTYVAVAVVCLLVLVVGLVTAFHEYVDRRLMYLAQAEFQQENKEQEAKESEASERDPLSHVPGVRAFRALPFWELSQDSLRKWEKGKLISIFSVKVSCKKLMAPSTEVAKPTDHLNGMRVISMFWIILGHSFLMAAGISGYDNPEQVVASGKGAASDISFQFIIGGHIAVDSFFYMSGFLLAYLVIKEVQKKGIYLNTKYIGVAIIYRYLRLTPSLAFMLMVYYRIVMYLGDGPFNPRFQHSVTRRCNGGRWVTELLYTMNFWPWHPDNVCMGWTWYLGCDFIFYILSLFIVGVYLVRKWAGWLLLIAFLVASWAYTFHDVWENRIGIYLFDGVYEKYSYWAYSRPWNRFPTYLVGVAAAWVHLYATEKKWPALPGTAFLLVNVFGMLLMLYIVVIPWTTFKWPNSWTRAQNSAYILFGRPAWALGLAIVSLSCISVATPPSNEMVSVKSDKSIVLVDSDSWRNKPYANPTFLLALTNRMLALYIWVPLARLTYSAYLVHPIIIKLLGANEHAYYHFSYVSILERTAANCMWSYVLAFVIYVLVERPTLEMTMTLMK